MPAKCICVIMLSIACLSGCRSSHTEPAEVPAPRVVITSDNIDLIVGMQWTLEAMVINGSEYPLSEKLPFIEFESSQRLSGFASVNRIFGSIQIDLNGAVKWAPMGTTSMAGPIERMNQETTFLSILQQAKAFTLVDLSLHAHTPNAETTLVFRASVD